MLSEGLKALKALKTIKSIPVGE